MDTVTGVGVLDKSVAVLGAIVDQPMTLADLQVATGLPRATVHRLANALVSHGFLRRDDHQRYDLGTELVALGRAARDRFPLAVVAGPTIEHLRLATGESVQMFVAEGEQRRCVRSLPSPHALQWVVPEGALYPIDQGSAGRVLVGEIGSGGWTATVAEREPGVASVSAPVRDGDGGVLAAVSVSGPIERMGSNPGSQFGVQVVDAADEISRLLAAGV